MSKTVMLYCVLTLLLVMGAFASMALNGYGVLIMCYAALGFSFTFLVELIVVARRQDITVIEKRMLGIELAALSSLTLLYALEGLTIVVVFGSVLIPVMFVILAVTTLYNLFHVRGTLMDAPVKVRLGVLAYFGSLVLLLIACYLFGHADSLAVTLTLAALSLIVVFFFLSGKRNLTIVAGENTNPWRVVWNAPNKSAILLTGLALMALYFSLRTVDLLPPLYFGSMPNGYSKLVREARNSDDEAKRSELKSFEAAYRKFQQND